MQTIFQCVARELFRNDISWGRIAALYSLSGGLAIDCVKVRPSFNLIFDGIVFPTSMFICHQRRSPTSIFVLITSSATRTDSIGSIFGHKRLMRRTCLRQLGHPEYIMTIVNALALFVERDLAQWIAQQGGWVGFLHVTLSRSHELNRSKFCPNHQVRVEDYIGLTLGNDCRDR